MKSILSTIIEECTKRGVQVEIIWNHKAERLEYVVHGFSKSGTVNLVELNNYAVDVFQRYDQCDTINNFDGLVSIAWDWFISYRDREPFTEPDSQWVSAFIQYGFLEKQEVTKTVYRIK